MSDDADHASPADRADSSSPHVVHQDQPGNVRDDGHSASAVNELSTDSTDGESTDLASEALRTARLIAAGRSAAQPSRRLRRYGRGRRTGEAGGYSGARPDGRDPMSIGAIVERSSKDLGWVAPLAEGRLLGIGPAWSVRRSRPAASR